MKKPSPALVIAILALFVALSGTSYAVSKLPKNSVGNSQLAKNAVTSSKVKDHSLVTSDFKPGQLPAGVAGAKGDKGDTGAPGPTAIGFGNDGPDWGLNDTSWTPVATMPGAANPNNPGPIVLTGETTVLLDGVVPLVNTPASVLEAHCRFEQNKNASGTWTAVVGSDVYLDVAAGPARDATLPVGSGLVLGAGSYRFRVVCRSSAATGLAVNWANLNVVAEG
jgi:hypothetical protein